MSTIRELLESLAAGKIITNKLSWGAKASDYEREIAKAAASGLVPVLIELEVDMKLPTGTIIIDHHGKRAGAKMPTSLDQVFDLLGLDRDKEWTRWFELVAANDRGHIDGMKRMLATVEEMREIRQAEWRALGIDEKTEQAVRAAIDESLRTKGRLALVTIPNDASSVATDLLHADLGGPGFENLLVIQPQKMAFYGDGNIIKKLAKNYPGCWYGGSLPQSGYWGIDEPDRDKRQKIIAHIKKIATG